MMRSLGLVCMVFLALAVPVDVAVGQQVPQAGNQAANTLTVRTRESDNFSRLIFPFTAQVTYQVSDDNQQLSIVFDTPTPLDISALQDGMLAGVQNARVVSADASMQLLADIPAGTTVRHLRSGTAIVVDIAAPAGTVLADIGFDRSAQPSAAQTQTTGGQQAQAPTQQTAAPQSPQNPSGQAQATPAQGQASPAQGQAAAADQPAVPTDGLAGAVIPSGDSAASGIAVTSAQDAVTGSPDREEENAQSIEFAEPAPESDDSVISAEDIERARLERDALNLDVELPADQLASANDPSQGPEQPDNVDIQGNFGRQFDLMVNAGTQRSGQEVILDIQEIDGGQQLRFNWPERVAAAAFERVGALWLVFDRPYGLNVDRLLQKEDIAARRISEITVEDHPDALIVRIAARADQNYTMSSDGRNWLVSMKDTPTAPRFPLTPTRRVDPAVGQQIFIPATNIGREIEFEDPIVGDLLVVMPLADEGRGIAVDYSNAVAEIPETAQGVLVVPLTDFVRVDRFRDGVAISAEGTDLFQGSGVASLAAATPGASNALIDFNSWRLGPAFEYRKYEARALYALSVTDTDRGREDARLQLARFYLGHSRAAEALGIMQLMIEDNASFERDPRFRAMRGVANLKMGRLREAEADLTVRDLANEQDIDLWRALLYEQQGDYSEALSHFRRGRDLLGNLDAHDRTEVQLAVIHSALEIDDVDTAEREVRLLRGVALTGRQQAEADYLTAVLYQLTGQTEDAQIIFESLSENRDRRISALSRYRSTLESVAQGQLPLDEAAERLERLRYVWRGDNFEAQLMDELGQIYYDLGRYSDSLEILRQAVSIYPDESRERRILSRMTGIFRELYLDGKADELSPISAISLWLRFRDLTPLGAEGDLMIRRLADRLVEVELLDRAAELLEYQVAERLEGAARAQVAANLAAIHTRNAQPDRALAVLRATREPQLPRDIQANRRWVEARALIDLTRFEEAEVLLENDLSANAERLRSELYWQSRSWAKLVDTNRRLLGDSYDRGEPLDEVQRVHLMRLTLALTFLEDKPGLIELRAQYSTLMRDGNFANGFELLTSDQELTGQELSAIASQIASVQKLQDFLQEYRSDFEGR